MACSNCFNGCSEITSDKCVKYTGPTIALLGITNGDTLLSVENNITTYLLTALDGTGIVPYIDPLSLCTLVSGYLPVSGDITLVHIVDAIFKSLCDLQTQVTANRDELDALNSTYTTDCLTGIVDDTDTHEVLDAAIAQICLNITAISDLALDLSTNYIAITDIDSYIAAYLITIGDTLQSSKMLPYTAFEYYGPLTYFDASGAGTGDWVDIYLCNGNNGTPDKRGRVGVGAIVGMGGGALDAAVDPATSTNPNYAVSDKSGANVITLTTAQIPSHDHTASASNDGDHNHKLCTTSVSGNNPIGVNDYLDQYQNSGGNLEYALKGTSNVANRGITSTTGDHTHTITIDPTGGGDSHGNIQPVLACYYIIYLP